MRKYVYVIVAGCMWYSSAFAISPNVELHTVTGLENTLVAHVSNSPLERVIVPLEKWRVQTTFSSHTYAHIKTVQLDHMQEKGTPGWDTFVIETVIGWYTVLALLTHSAIIFYSILGLVLVSVCARLLLYRNQYV